VIFITDFPGQTIGAMSSGQEYKQPAGCPDTSVRICHYSLRNDPEERSSELFRGGSLESHKRVTQHTNVAEEPSTAAE
jgi:hypothetical protein